MLNVLEQMELDLDCKDAGSARWWHNRAIFHLAGAYVVCWRRHHDTRWHTYHDGHNFVDYESAKEFLNARYVLFKKVPGGVGKRSTSGYPRSTP